MYGFPGTKCKIEGCENPVWPNKTLGYCNRHYLRHKTGRMTINGELLPLPLKTKICESCGKSFIILNRKAQYVRFCPPCRPVEYAKNQKENRYGIYRWQIRKGGCINTEQCKHRREQQRQEQHSKAIKRAYVAHVLNKIIKACKRRVKHKAKYKDMLLMRENGNTYNEIAKHFGCSRQNVHQICSQYARMENIGVFNQPKNGG